MRQLVAMLIAVTFAASAASAQAPAAPGAPVATPVHKKAAPSAKHKKVSVKKDHIKKS